MFTVLHRPQFICQAEVFWMQGYMAASNKSLQKENRAARSSYRFFSLMTKKILKQTCEYTRKKSKVYLWSYLITFWVTAVACEQEWVTWDAYVRISCWCQWHKVGKRISLVYWGKCQSTNPWTTSDIYTVVMKLVIPWQRVCSLPSLLTLTLAWASLWVEIIILLSLLSKNESMVIKLPVCLSVPH
jgi:hypothetical protein